jgi:hypothetical protein
MSYQSTHGKPLATGHVSRMPPTARDFLAGIPFLSTFLAHELEMDSSISDISHQLRMLADGNIRYIVVHKRFMHEGYIDRWRDWLTMEPIYEDEEVVVFSTDPQFGRDFEINQRLTEEIGLIRASVLPNQVLQQNQLKLDTRWGSAAAPAAEYDVCFDLTGQEISVPLSCQPISSEWPTDRWQASEIVKANYSLSIGPAIDPGTYELTAQLADESGERVGEMASLDAVQVVANDPESVDPVHWQNGMSLIGHTRVIENDVLSLDMFWQSDNKMADSYVIFVHLLDIKSGKLAAQSDGIPQDWAYPTMIWTPGETVLDQRSLNLRDVPAGDYALAVGLYDQVSGERITAVGQSADTADAVPIFSFTR